MPDVGEAGPSTAAHRMRITSAGSISNYVKFAKTFLLDNPDRSLVLHTIPSDSTSSARGSGTIKSSSTLHSCTTTVPRLISVVEQIKRELIYPPKDTPGSNTKRKMKGVRKEGSIRGVWQYTESGLLPAPPREEEDVDPLVRVLEGTTRPKMTHRPYMQITLSTKPLDLEKEQNVSCQYILTKRRNRSLLDESDKGAENPPQDIEEDRAADTEMEGRSSDVFELSQQAGRQSDINRAGTKVTKRKSSSSQEIQSREKKRVKKVREVKGAA